MFSLSRMFRFLIVGGMLMLSSTAARGQSIRGAVTGTVVDASGAALPGASVTLRHPTVGIERTVAADSAGAFSFPDLPPGEYTLNARATGFSGASKVVVLASDEARAVEFTLQPGGFAEDVTLVTARLATLESLQHIPGTVEIVDRQTIETSRVFNFNEVLRKVSGVNVREEEGFGLRPNIGIRGLNPTRSTKVLLLEDGVPLAYSTYGDNASYYHPPVERFETVEVLKGSGQVVHGPVTVAGVINYITPNPPDKPAGSLLLTGGNRDYFNGHANYGGTWGKTGFLVDYLRKQGEGARVNTRHGLNDATFKLVTTFNPRNILSLKTNYYGERSQLTYSGLRLDEYLADPRSNPFQNDRTNFNRFGISGTHTLLLTNNFVMNTTVYGQMFLRDWWRQSSNSGQRPNDAADPKCGGMANLNTTCGNEGRLRKYYTIGVDPRFKLNHALFGIRNEADFGFRFHAEIQDRRQVNGDTPTARSGVTVEDNDRRNQAYSSFIQNRFIFGKFTVTPGVRVERINYQRTNRLANNGAGVTGKTDLTQVIPGLGVAYNFNERATLFAGVHRGFAPPRTEDVVNNTTGGVVDLDPELSWNYEIGIRSMPTQGVRIDAAYFRMDYSNQIVPASLAGGVGATLTNGGSTRHEGLELNARADSGTILHSAHNFFARFNYTFVGTAKFTGARFSNVSGFATTSVTGNRLPYSPRHLATTTFGYSHAKGFDVQMEAAFVGDQFGDDLNTIASSADGQRGLIPGYTIWNLTANHRVEQWRTTFFVTVKNLFDDTFIVDRARGILPSSPRLVQGGLKFRF